MARDVDNVINTAADPVESLVVSASTVASKLQTVSNITGKLWGKVDSRSSPYKRSGMYPYNACVRRILYVPC